jgi:hypothetical protein
MKNHIFASLCVLLGLGTAIAVWSTVGSKYLFSGLAPGVLAFILSYALASKYGLINFKK